MKIRYNALQSFALMMSLLLVGVSGAWADLKKSQMGNDVCSPKIHFQLPDGWTTAYLMIGGQGVAFPKADADGWSMIDLGATKTNDGATFFINDVNNSACNNSRCVTTSGIITGLNGDANSVGFTCSSIGKDDGMDFWIMAHPDVKKEGAIYTKNSMPVIRDFYVFLPNNTTWKSAEPMLYEVAADGKAVDTKMYNDADNCGWYYRRYIDEDIPKSVLIHRDDDEDRADAIGQNGAWEENPTATPIPLYDFMEAFVPPEDFQGAVYFVADEEEAKKLANKSNPGWSTTRPAAQGTCGYDLAAIIYDTDASLHGAFTCAPNWSQAIDGTEKVKYNACYYNTAKFPVNSTGEAVVPCVGVTKGMVESTLATDPTTKKKYMVLTAKGKQCFGAQAEAAFKAMFNYTEGVNEQYCFNMAFSQAKDGKFEFESDNYKSPGAPVTGGFYPAEQEPDATMMISPRLAAAETKRKAEGPTFFCPDDPNNKTSQTPMGLRTLHEEQGVPLSDLICNGGGWEGGIDCEGLFSAGSEFSKDGTPTEDGERIQAAFKKSYGKNVTWGGDGWGWSCEWMAGAIPDTWPALYDEGTENIAKPNAQGQNSGKHRWTSTEGGNGDDGKGFTKAGRNQHFCFESHATFRFKKNLKFSFRGDDDIWVFINNKLAVDLGGTHLAAPGFVDLDKFMPDAKVGDTYPIDIFFCDRRTTMSNVHIKTNMFIEQKNGIDPLANQDKADYFENGNNHYLICYTESGDGSCAAALSASVADSTCGSNIKQPITYEFTKDKTGANPADVVVSVEDFKASPKQYGGGIDVSKPGEPIINKDILKNYFAKGGQFYLLIHIGNQTRAIEVKITGSIGIADRNAEFVDDNDNHIPGFDFKGRAMASNPADDGSIALNQMVPLYIAAISDPCTGEGTCDKNLELSSAKGSPYTLTVTNDKALFYELKNGVLSPFKPSDNRKIGDGGVDTIYVTIPFDEMKSAVETVSISVSGTTRTANVDFFVPTLKFVDSDSTFKVITKDADSYIRMKGQSYNFYVVALNPDTTICTDCNFSLLRSASLSSTGVDLISAAEVVNGRATFTIRSSVVYLRDDAGNGTATFTILGPSTKLMSASYTNMQFQEPPVPTPQFADIFDVYGAPSSIELNMPEKYLSKTGEYLDGKGDSLVVYYHRQFNKDSLPNKIVVYWSDDKKDSVVFDETDIARGVSCGAAFGLDEDVCLNRIALSRVEDGKHITLSKDVKTTGTGTVKSWATYCPKFNDDGKTCATDPVTANYEGIIYDRIAPIIVSARTIADGTAGDLAQLKLTFSEKVQKTTQGSLEGDKVFSYYINNGKNSQYADYIPLAANITLADKIAETHTLLFSKSSTFPQSGDYIHFRGLEGVGFMEDQSEYKIADSLRNAWSADDAAFAWNTAPAYDATVRLPSPWVQITGDVNSFVKRIRPDAIGFVPLTVAEAAVLPPTEVIPFDANKDEGQFMEAMIAKSSVDPAMAKYGFAPNGWFIKSDMGALIESKEQYTKLKKEDVYLDYDMHLYSNLGAHVLSEHKRIYCDDEKNKLENGRYYFEGKNCVDVRRNFFVVWNDKNLKSRFVGTGAFISKIKTFVKLGNVDKKNKHEKSEMWGVRSKKKK